MDAGSRTLIFMAVVCAAICVLLFNMTSGHAPHLFS